VDYAKLNIARMTEKIHEINDSLSILQNYVTKGKDVFLASSESVLAARYVFIVMIEASSNIANHLCARQLKTSPGSYAESFILLGKKGIIDNDLSLRLSKMVGFRNLLVHGYGKVDDEIMFDIMCNNLEDIELWLNELNYFIDQADGGENNA